MLILERETGLEPATSSLGSWHSTTELLPLDSTTRTYQNTAGMSTSATAADCYLLLRRLLPPLFGSIPGRHRRAVKIAL